MTVAVVGNSGPGYSKHGLQGIGGRAFPTGMAWVGIVNNEAEDSYVISIADIVTGDINQGIFFQASKPVTIEFTLSNPGTACSSDPLEQDLAIWTTPFSVPAGEIISPEIIFTALRITFPTAGTEVYIGVR